MRISGFAVWLRATPIAFFAALALPGATPAYGQSWDVLTNPAQNSLGQSYCMLWYGESRPMMNFTIRDDGAHFIVIAANEFSGVPQQDEAAYRVPSGEILIVGYNAPQPGVILSNLGQVGFEQFLHHFEDPGEFYISVGGQRVHFPVADMGPKISTLWQCAAALP